MGVCGLGSEGAALSPENLTRITPGGVAPDPIFRAGYGPSAPSCQYPDGGIFRAPAQGPVFRRSGVHAWSARGWSRSNAVAALLPAWFAAW